MRTAYLWLMSTRKIRENLGPGGEATAARGGMMMVAGKEDLDDDLLFDDETCVKETDDAYMTGPIYPEGRTIRIKVGDLRRLLARKVT